jgi:PST family polysaccharide transporter
MSSGPDWSRRVGGALRRNTANLVALTAVQAANALVPVLVFPFALVKLGSETFTKLAVAEALSVIVLTAVLYSFEVDGVGRVIAARAPERRRALQATVSAIIATRLLLFAVAAAMVVGGYTLVTGESPLLLACWLLVPLGHVFFSYWFFQGMEANRPVAFATLTARVTGVALVFTLIHKADDVWIMPLALGVPFLIGGLGSALYLFAAYGLRPTHVCRRDIVALLRGGKEIVTGNVAVMLYRDLNVVLLGFAGVSAPGIAAYSLAEKFTKMLQASVRPLSQLFFPKMIAALHGEAAPSRENAMAIARMTLPQITLVTLGMGAVAVGYAVAARYALLPANWSLPPETLVLIGVMLPAILAGIANFMFGVGGLNHLNRKLWILSAIVATGLCNLVLCPLLARSIGALGGAICFLFSEFLLLALVLFAFTRNGTIGAGRPQ